MIHLETPQTRSQTMGGDAWNSRTAHRCATRDARRRCGYGRRSDAMDPSRCAGVYETSSQSSHGRRSGMLRATVILAGILGFERTPRGEYAVAPLLGEGRYAENLPAFALRRFGEDSLRVTVSSGAGTPRA